MDFPIPPTNPATDDTTRATDATTFDAIIVGAGMAGLLAAYTLLARRPTTRLAVLDQGPTLDQRIARADSGTAGFGGAGLYLGGRLYLGPAEVPVLPPVSAPPGMHGILSGEEYLARARAVDALIQAFGVDAPLTPAPSPALAEAVARAAEVGIEYITSYPARVVPATQRHALLARLRAWLSERGAVFCLGARVQSVEATGEGFRVTAGGPERFQDFQARALLMAPGRYGTEWLIGTVRALGVDVLELPATFGVRIELPARTYEPLTSITPDPRLQMRLGNDAVIKTYATCPGGYVVPIERYGMLVASGVPILQGQRRANTTVAILVQPGWEGSHGTWQGGNALAERVHERAPRQLLLQRLADARAGRPTTPDALRANSVQPSAEALPGALHDLYPAAYWEAYEAFLGRIGELAAGADSGDTLLYAPAEERFWYVPVDARLQTAVPGCFVAGDAAGQSQGAVQAGVTGLLAGESVAGYLG